MALKQNRHASQAGLTVKVKGRKIRIPPTAKVDGWFVITTTPNTRGLVILPRDLPFEQGLREWQRFHEACAAFKALGKP
jgi:hypothetical protein